MDEFNMDVSSLYINALFNSSAPSTVIANLLLGEAYQGNDIMGMTIYFILTFRFYFFSHRYNRKPVPLLRYYWELVQ
jgi:hypothetical protein